MSETKNVAQEPEKFDLRSEDIAADKQGELRRLFPDALSEGGKIDLDRLKLALGEDVDVGKERFGLTWPGKTECFKTIQSPSLGTLLPCPEESVNWDTTENLIIEGDNLEVLKLLQKSYLGKVKMIYIDPPYNTGNDFIYPDNYTESLQTYLEYTGQVDSEGRTFSTNTDTEGRFHSKWLNMMYPRLYLARNLLTEDGIIFISIDDGEQAPLKLLADEVFGEENLLANIAWEKRYTRSNNAKLFYSLKDSILAYRRSAALSLLREERTAKSEAIYTNPDDDPRGPWTSSSYVNPVTREQRPNLTYPIQHPSTGDQVNHPTHAWKYAREQHELHVAEARLWWGKGGKAIYPRLKNFLSEMGDGLVPIDLWDYETSGTTDEGGLEVKSLFGEAIFDNPKPTRLIRRMLSLIPRTDTPPLVLDFFAGSGATAHAALAANAEGDSAWRFILVQLPEPTERTDYPTVADITEERVRRVIDSLNSEEIETLPSDGQLLQDRGFRVFKLAESNLVTWDTRGPENVEELSEQLEMHVNHARDSRSDQDLLFELLLKSGFSLATEVEVVSCSDTIVYSVASHALVICLEKRITLELVNQIANLDPKPERVVCLDEGFAGDDQLKVNATETFRTRGITSFKTV